MDNFYEKAKEIIKKSEKNVEIYHKEIDEICEFNQYKVLKAMQENRLSERHFAMSTGYGYNDEGRDVTEKIFAKVFGGEASIVRPQIVSGTHAISLCLYGVLRPHDHLLSITGDPYETIRLTIGLGKKGSGLGTLKEYGIDYSSVSLLNNGDFDFEAIKKEINENTKMIFIQRSTGYDERNAITIKKIKQAVSEIKKMKSDLIFMVDNCYGEFLEKEEPLEVGADLIAGSLIKNPGGGLVHIGGYVIGKESLVKKTAARLTAPGIALEVGANLGVIRSYLQGLFMAPKVTAEAIKGAILAGEAFTLLGYEVFPKPKEERSDIIQAVKLGSAKKINAYCKGIQMASPVDSYVTPEAWDMPGYDDEIIMAAGNFVQGSSIELSADAPMRAPYIVYQQGGLTYEHSKIGTTFAISEVLKVSKEG